VGQGILVNVAPHDIGEIVFDYADVAGPEVRTLPTLKVERPILELEVTLDARNCSPSGNQPLRSFVVQRKGEPSLITVRGHDLRRESESWLAVIVHEGQAQTIVALFRADAVEGIYEELGSGEKPAA
jgi:hypothetical protein